MREIVQHIPGFVGGVDPVIQTVPDMASVFQIPFIQRWEADPGFGHWSISEPHSDRPMLMATLKNGEFWVVAFARSGRLEGLPEWVYPGPSDP